MEEHASLRSAGRTPTLNIQDAIRYHNAGLYGEAEIIYEGLIKKNPRDVNALNLLGLLEHQTGRHELAVRHLKSAASIHPDSFIYLNLGLAYQAAAQLDDAVNSYRRAIELNNDYVEAIFNLGTALALQENYREAADIYRQALGLNPNLFEAYIGLGNVHRSLKEFDRALESYELAISKRPDLAEGYILAGHALFASDKLDLALQQYEKALGFDSRNAEVLAFIGNVYANQGKNDRACQFYTKAISLKPEDPDLHTSLLLTAQYSSNITAQELFELHRRFGLQFESPFKPLWPRHLNERNPGKRLKIGYVSPDFRQHPVAYFLAPILARHDKSQVEVYCYYSHEVTDGFTERIRAQSDCWIQCHHLSDEQLAEQIRKDGIDILVDLAGHTMGNRLLAFARKPAPVQVTYLGYPATTGLTAIDYRITDSYVEPEGLTDHLSVEKLWRLPEIFCCYAPSPNSPVVIEHPPYEDNGYITFGCFNNYAKVTDPVLVLWARILEQVPDARLMLEIKGLDSAQFKAEVEERFESFGISRKRLILINRDSRNQYVLYNRIDIALDPFPANGGTTSFDTLWMGVPFVTLPGKTFISRMGVTILTNAKMPELVAEDEEDYVRIASQLALDQTRLKRMRDGLREQVKSSPLMDMQRFTGHLEQAYRQMWTIWCQQHQ